MSIRPNTIIGAYLCALALWAQLLAPAAALTMDHSVDPFSIICSQGKDHGPQPPQHHHQRDCCVLCHAVLAGLGSDPRPAYVAFDYPVSSPLRWRSVRPVSPGRLLPPDHRPRGPPALV